MKKKKIIVAICGASGVEYGLRLLKFLLEKPVEVHLILSPTGKKVLAHESGFRGGDILSFIQSKGLNQNQDASIHVFEPDDLFAPSASGSFRHNGMVIVPCSMKTLGKIASGIPENLIQRAADVCLKERRPLILVPRETPLNPIHLKNMYKAAISGAVIMPPSPAFYFHPATIEDLLDTIVARILDHLDIKHHLAGEWGGENIVS